MRVIIYFHPQRTIVSRWVMDAGVPTLTLYQEVGTEVPLSNVISSSDDVTAVIHSSNVVLHSYPIDPEEDLAERRTFEIATCLPHLHADDDVVLDVSMAALLHKTQWQGLLVFGGGKTKCLLESLTGRYTIVPDILLDVQAALATVPVQASPWVLIGKRGATWYRVLIGVDHTLQYLDTYLAEPTLSAGEVVRDAVLELRAATGAFIERVLLFGDGLTKSTFEDIKETVLHSGIEAGRLQPFRTVRAEIDPETKAKIVSKSHLLGPLVGAALLTVPTEV